MYAQPDRDIFRRLYSAGTAQVVWTRAVNDLETPVSAFLKLAEGKDNAFLFESITGGEIRGRYSFIGFAPDLIWRAYDGHSEINRSALADPDTFTAQPGQALQNLRTLIHEVKIPMPNVLPPGAAGLFGFLGYDMVRQMEQLPNANPRELNLPDAMMMRPTVVAAFDSIENVITFITPVYPCPNRSSDAAYELARERLGRSLEDLERSLPGRRAGTHADAASSEPEPQSNIERDDYFAIVERAKEYIRAGDVFQVVPSQRFRRPFTLPPFDLYRALRRLNPSPFLFFLNMGGAGIVGSSPEILVRVRDGTITVRPIAGTRPRGATPAEDQRLARELLADEKERAEHLMLLDLGRNDVGRFAATGTVRVTEEFIIERYSHVMHIVSNVEGALADGYDALDALIGGFPAGTVSGAPKIRAMEIIDELEPSRRALYGGGVGYFGANGEMDICIALRTALVQNETMFVQAGGGVVYDSDPEAEYTETVNKAKALMRAAAEATRFASVKS